MLAFVVASIVVAILLVFVGHVDRGENGLIRWSGQVWVLVGLAIVTGWISAGWAMWVDPDRLREGPEYWGLAIPIFGIGYFALSMICLLGWWVAYRFARTGWAPALVVALLVSPLAGLWGAGAILIACLAASFTFARPRPAPAKT